MLKKVYKYFFHDGTIKHPEKRALGKLEYYESVNCDVSFVYVSKDASNYKLFQQYETFC